MNVVLTLTLSVLKATVLQSGKMLIDFRGSLYEMFRNRTVTAFLSSLFTRNAAHTPEVSSNI